MQRFPISLPLYAHPPLAWHLCYDEWSFTGTLLPRAHRHVTIHSSFAHSVSLDKCIVVCTRVTSNVSFLFSPELSCNTCLIKYCDFLFKSYFHVNMNVIYVCKIIYFSYQSLVRHYFSLFPFCYLSVLFSLSSVFFAFPSFSLLASFFSQSLSLLLWFSHFPHTSYTQRSEKRRLEIVFIKTNMADLN